MEDTDKDKKRNMLATSIASPFAGMIAKFVMHPIDTIKAKVQVNRMELKSVSDYKVGMVTNLSNLYLMKLNKHSEIKVFLDSLEESPFLCSALPLPSLSICQLINTQRIIWLSIKYV